MTGTVEKCDIAGLPVFWTHSTRSFEAQIVVGVGLRDEPPHLLGITHLVEHLIFRAAGDLVVPNNGGTEDAHTWFQAQGDVTLVLEALRRVTLAFDPDTWDEADLDREKRIVAVEAGERLQPARSVAATRFGLGSFGNSDAGVPTLPGLTWEEVTSWARRWFVAENVAVTVNGPPPDLRLQLPPGSPAAGRTQLVDRLPGGRMVASEKAGVAFSLILPEEGAPILRDAVEHALLAELRGRSALIYSAVPSMSVDLRDGRCLLGFVLDGLPEDTAEVARQTVRTLRHLADHGFGASALTAAQQTAVSALGDPMAWEHHAESLAVAHVLGLAPPADPSSELARARRWSDDDLTLLLREALPSLQVLVDEEDDGVDDELASSLDLIWDDGNIWRSHSTALPRGRGRFRGRGVLGLRDRAVVTEDSLYYDLCGDARRIPLGDVAVAGRFASGDVALIDVQGRSTVVEIDWWRRSAKMTETLIAALPPHVDRDFSWFDEQPERSERL